MSHLLPGQVLQGHQHWEGPGRQGLGLGRVFVFAENDAQEPTDSFKGQRGRGKSLEKLGRLCACLPSNYRRCEYLRFQVSTLPTAHHILPGESQTRRTEAFYHKVCTSQAKKSSPACYVFRTVMQS